MGITRNLTSVDRVDHSVQAISNLKVKLIASNLSKDSETPIIIYENSGIHRAKTYYGVKF